MQRTGWVGASVAILIMAGAGGARLVRANGQGNSEHAHQKACSVATLRGAYGVQFQGTRPVPPPPFGPGGIEAVVAVVLRTYDGEGNTSQIENAHGSVTGTLPD